MDYKMTKLKTLKDIHMEEYMRLIIKAEAIKWVKWLRTRRMGWGKSSVFMDFFNITEEDLKDA